MPPHFCSNDFLQKLNIKVAKLRMTTFPSGSLNEYYYTYVHNNFATFIAVQYISMYILRYSISIEAIINLNYGIYFADLFTLSLREQSLFYPL
jgi:hypothetical protein